MIPIGTASTFLAGVGNAISSKLSTTSSGSAASKSSLPSFAVQLRTEISLRNLEKGVWKLHTHGTGRSLSDLADSLAPSLQTGTKLNGSVGSVINISA